MFCLQCGQRLSPAEPEGEVLAETRAADIPMDLGGPGARSAGGGFQSSRFEARLRVEQGSVDEQTIVLDRPLLRIGRRQQGSDIVIHDTNVSREHARIEVQGDRVTIEDTNSSNGTIVNDERIDGRQELRPGDVIRIGDAVFVFEKEELEDEVAPPEGSTMAIDLDSPMTSLGGAPELVPPGLISGHLGPLTPPPPMMDPRQTSLADTFLVSEPELSKPPTPAPAEPPPPSAPVSSPQASEPPPPSVAPAASAPPGPSHSEAVASSVRAAFESTPPHASGASAARRPASSGGGTDSLEALRRELNDVGGDLVAFAGTLNGLAERVERLEQALDAASGDLDRVAEAVRGPDATVLRELQGILDEIERDTDTPSLDEAMRVLGQLSAQPRDIELLLRLSQQAGAIESALRIHGRLVAVAPRVRASLARLVS